MRKQSMKPITKVSEIVFASMLTADCGVIVLTHVSISNKIR